MKTLISRLKQPPSTLVKNAGWLLSVEGVAKISRVVTILCMAALLTPVDYGIVILAVAFHDLFRMLMRSGTGNQVIQCQESDLPAFARNAAALQWAFCIGIAALQPGMLGRLSVVQVVCGEGEPRGGVRGHL